MTHIDIDALARLARIALTDEEKITLATEVAEILAMGECLSVAPAPIVAETPEGVLRPDEPSEGLAREEILAMAPTSAEGYVTVPHVLSDDENEEVEA